MRLHVSEARRRCAAPWSVLLAGFGRLQRMSDLMPGPCGPDDGRKIRMCGMELQDAARRGGIGDQIGRIARSPQLDDVRHLAAGLGCNRAENLAHRKAGAGAEIESPTAMSLHQQFEGTHT